MDPTCENKICDETPSIYRNSDAIGKEYSVKRLIIHNWYQNGPRPDGKGKRIQWDFCLVQTKKSMILDEQLKTKAIAIAPKNFKINGRRCYVAGWGRTNKTVQGISSVPAKFLQKTRLVNQMHTEQRFNFHCRNARFFGAFCAKGQKETHGTCKGDSGGPYFCKENGKFYLVGMTSYGLANRNSGCGNQGWVH